MTFTDQIANLLYFHSKLTNKMTCKLCHRQQGQDHKPLCEEGKFEARLNQMSAAIQALHQDAISDAVFKTRTKIDEARDH